MDFLKNIIEFCRTINETAQNEASNSISKEPANNVPKEPAKPMPREPKGSCYTITESDIDQLTLMIESRCKYFQERMAYNKKLAKEYIKHGYKMMALSPLKMCNQLNAECAKFQERTNGLVMVMFNAMNTQMIAAMAEQQVNKLEAYTNNDNQAVINKLDTCKKLLQNFDDELDRVMGNGYSSSNHREGDLTLADIEEEIRREQMAEDSHNGELTLSELENAIRLDQTGTGTHLTNLMDRNHDRLNNRIH